MGIMERRLRDQQTLMMVNLRSNRIKGWQNEGYIGYSLNILNRLLLKLREMSPPLPLAV